MYSLYTQSQLAEAFTSGRKSVCLRASEREQKFVPRDGSSYSAAEKTPTIIDPTLNAAVYVLFQTPHGFAYSKVKALKHRCVLFQPPSVDYFVA